MKKINHILALALTLSLASSLKGGDVTFSNFDGSGTLLTIVDSTDTPLDDATSSVAVGFFTDVAAVSSGDFSSFNQFGSSTILNPNNFDGFLSGQVSDTVGTSSFVGQQITLFITNPAGDEFLVAQTNTTFETENPVFDVTVNLQMDPVTYLFGGAPGSIVTLPGLGNQPSIRTAPVPEPSTYALFAGILSIGFVAVRRHRSRSQV